MTRSLLSALAVLAAFVGVNTAGCTPPETPPAPTTTTAPAPPPETTWWVNPFGDGPAVGLSLATIRTVAPSSLATPDGWNAATSAVTTGPAPLWQRGDSAIPIETNGGTLLVYADTLARNGSGTQYLARNTALMVRPDGRVQWLSAGPAVGSVAVPAPAGQWWWPAGGISADQGAILFGSLWAPGGGVYGTHLGPAVTQFLNAAPSVVPIGLDAGKRWGPPAVVGAGSDRRVYLVGFDNATWGQTLASHPYSNRAADYATGWTTEPLAITGGPLGPLAIDQLGGRWVVSAKRLSSAPELNYEELPEIAAWEASNPAGPFTRVGNVYEDTRRPGTRSYAGHLTRLPHIGRVASWSRNVMPGNTGGPDEYGTIFAEATPV